MEQLPARDVANQAESFGAATVAFLKQLFAVIRRRKLLLCTGLLLVYGLGALYYFSRDSVYESRASVLVHLVGDALTGRSDDRLNYIPTHMQLITSTAVLDRALERLKANDAESRDWPSTEGLADGVKVSCQKDTEILTIAYRTKDKARAAKVVEAVVGSYLDFVNETHRSTSKDILQILTQQRDELDRQLRDKESQLLALQQKEGILTLDDDRNNIAMARVLAVNNSLTQARVHRLELEARYRSLQEAIARGEPVEGFLLRYLDRLGTDTVSQNLGLKQNSETWQFQQASVRREIVRDQMELQRLTTMYGPHHPKVKMLEEQIHLIEPFTNPERQTPEQKAQSERDMQALAVQMLQEDIKEAKALEADLQQQCNAEKEAALKLNSRLAPFVALEIELKRLRNFYDTINNRMRQVNLGGDYGAITTQVIEPPQEPTAPVSPDPKKVAATTTLLGLFFGLGLCYLFEWWDTGYRSPEDIAQHLGLPVLGHIPWMSHPSEGQALELILEHSPQSAAAEAIRTLRTALMLCDAPPRKLTVTSPEPGDGKTLIVANLAVAFAKSGLRTLVIDGDMRRSRFHQIFQLGRTAGLSELLQQDAVTEAELLAAARATSVANLHVLPSGPNPPNPTELLTGERLAKILAWADTHYDRVICDAPPILAVSDCALIGRLLDGALMVIRADKNDRVSAARARDALRAMNCPVLGVIANSVHAGGTYGYGYGYYRQPAYYGPDHGDDGQNRQAA